jgi:hypothetical protein
VAISFKEAAQLERSQVLALYRSCGWGAAEKPDELMAALDGAHRVLTAWYDDRLVGLVYSISDGALVVYYPHLLVHPEHQGLGIGAFCAGCQPRTQASISRSCSPTNRPRDSTPSVDSPYQKGSLRFGSIRPSPLMWVNRPNEHATTSRTEQRERRLALLSALAALALLGVVPPTAPPALRSVRFSRHAGRLSGSSRSR